MAPRGWSDERLYKEYLNAEPETTEGTLAVRIDLRQLCADASKRLVSAPPTQTRMLLGCFLFNGPRKTRILATTC
eukprot:179265-Rhodomonas_salina.3